MDSFEPVLKRASRRKGSKEALLDLLPEQVRPDSLVKMADSYFLEEMTRSIFQSGFVWRVINSKWSTFREAFFDFEPGRLMKLTDAHWDEYVHDKRIVRNRLKIQALRHNVWFVNDISHEYEGFGRFLVEWPKNDLIGLFKLLKTRGSRLGGNAGQYFLQHTGVDSFALTKDVVTGLQLYGLDISDNPGSQKDHRLIQKTFNEWHEDSGFCYLHLSMILAYSVGENRVLSKPSR
jgi:3-methyladenine DNA glycosylase Tag